MNEARAKKLRPRPYSARIGHGKSVEFDSSLRKNKVGRILPAAGFVLAAYTASLVRSDILPASVWSLWDMFFVLSLVFCVLGWLLIGRNLLSIIGTTIVVLMIFMRVGCFVDDDCYLSAQEVLEVETCSASSLRGDWRNDLYSDLEDI